MSSNFIKELQIEAAKSPKSIIFPESFNEKVLQAARKIYDMGIAFPILVGNREKVEKYAQNIQVDSKGFNYIDFEDETVINETVEAYSKINSLLSVKAIRRKIKNPLNFAAVQVSLDQSDCLAAGITYTTGEVILSAQMFIGLQEEIQTVSSMGIVEVPDFIGQGPKFIGISDCAVCQNPSSEELADIACVTSDTYKAVLKEEPRAALVSFSTDGSSQHEIVDKVVEAVKMANAKRPDLKIDGEFQIDAALIDTIAKKKVKKESSVAGQANIIIFPDLNAGNIGVKLIQIFGGVNAHGPLLQGFKKPVTDFSRSAPVDEIVGNLTMLVTMAGLK